MSFLTVLLSLILGLLLLDIKNVLITVILLICIIFLFIRKIKKNKVVIILSIICLIIGILFNVIKIKENNLTSNYGLVVRTSENYVILRTFKEKFYVYNKGDLKLFDLICFSGDRAELTFTTYESSFDFKGYLNKNGIESSLKINNFTKIFSLPINIDGFKSEILSKFHHEETKDLARAILFNENSDYISDLKSEFMLANVLSVTGVLLNFLLYSASKFLEKFISNKLSRILSLLLLTPYIFINISKFVVVKTVVFFIIGIIFLEKEVDRFNLKNLILIIFLLLNHYLIYSLSFILSLIFMVFKELGHLYLFDKNRLKKRLKMNLFTILLFLPFSIEFYNSFNILRIVLNTLFVDAFKGIFVINIVSFYGLHLSFLEDLIYYLLIFLNKIELDFLSINLPAFKQLGYIVFYLLFSLYFYFREINFKRLYLNIGLVSTLSFALYCLPIEQLLTCEITFINVGQGDSTLIRYKNETILVDTGGIINYDLAKNSLIPFLRKNRIYDIDYCFITHYDYDHFGALDSLKSNFKVKEIIDYNAQFPIKTKYFDFNNLNHYWNELSDENDKSLVLYFKLLSKKILLMGDASKSVEAEIIKNTKIDVDILKLGHHGSSTSSSYEFLKTIDPNVAIISCGYKNKFKHPHEEVINNLNRLNIRYRRTDLEGTISYKFNLFIL